jgi:hypothetical protein
MQLIQLFNQGYDYARRLSDGGFTGSPEKGATHQLQCTHWNSDGALPKNFKQRLRAMKTRPSGFALSVCAVPLKGPRLRPTKHKFKRHLTGAEVPVYETTGGVEGKRAVLSCMARAHRTPTTMIRLIRHLSGSNCDALYLQFLRANRAALKKRRAS